LAPEDLNNIFWAVREIKPYPLGCVQMEKQEYKGTVIVGAGPAGSKTAHTLARKGRKALIIEEDRAIGKPVQCAGIVSTRTIEKSGLTKKQKYILNRVRGAVVHSPGGEKLEISRPETQALIIDRAIFDRQLTEKAVQEGVEIKTGCRAIQTDGRTIEVKTKNKKTKIKPKAIVGADGAKSTVRRSLGLPRPQKTLVGAQVTMTDIDIENTDFVEIFLGNKYAPGFFAWMIPTDSETARLGLCIDPSKASKPAQKYLETLLKQHPKASRYNGSEITWNYGSIPIGYTERQTKNNTLIVGDSAGQVKPTTGGGVYTGMVCGETAGKTIDNWLDGEKTLRQYEKQWKQKIGRELKLGMAIHRSMASLTDHETDKLIKKLSKPELINTIENYGDMDYPSTVGIKLLKAKPSLIKYLGFFARKFVGELL